MGSCLTCPPRELVQYVSYDSAGRSLMDRGRRDNIEPGSPWEDRTIESFNGKLRDELLKRETSTSSR
jgi:hypothetical protein